MIRLVLADDQEVVRMGFRMVIAADDDIEVVGEASDGAAAVEVVVKSAPDVVLMDVRMPGMDGIAATKAIMDRCPEVRVLVVTTFDLDEYVVSALRAGAAGFLLKDVEPAALVEGVRTVAQGDALVDSAVTRSLIDYAMRQREEPASAVDPHLLDPLSEREIQVLTAMARGLSNAQVGEALFLGETTVKSHVSSLLAKLHLRSRVQAVVLAYETGLVARGDVAYEELINDS